MTHPQIAQVMGGIPCLSLEEISAHPRLPHARKVYLREFLKVYGDDAHMSRLMIESSRFMVFQFAIVNYAAQDPAQPETWATVGKLKQIMQGFGSTSDRQVDILLTRLSDLGFLEIVRSEQDARVRIVKPTEAALAHDRDWLVAHYSPLVAAYPERRW